MIDYNWTSCVLAEYHLPLFLSPPPPCTGHSSLMPRTSASTHTVYVNPSTSGSSYPTFSHISTPPHTYSASHIQPVSQGEVPGNGAWHLNYSHSPMFPAFTGKSLIHPIRRLHSANRQEMLDLITVYMAVPCKNRRLFRRVFRSHCCV